MNRLYINKDWSTLKKLIAIKAAGGGAPLVEYTATGNPATFETNVIAPMELLIPFAPLQDLHGYDNPWPGGGGKNLFDAEHPSVTSSNGVNYVYNSDGSITLSGTANSNASLFFFTLPNEIPSGSYVTFSLNNSDTNSEVGVRLVRRESGSIANLGTAAYADVVNKTMTVTPTGYNANEINIFVKTNHGAVSEITLKIQCEMGHTVTDWTPYANICPISGRTGAEIRRTGANLLDPVNYETFVFGSNTRYGKKFAPGTYTIINTGGTGHTAYYRDGMSGTSEYVDPGTKSTVTTTNDLIVFTTVATRLSEICVRKDGGNTYEQYNAEVYSITFPSSAGTVYGGTLTVNKDGTGKLVVDWGILDNVSGWGYASSQSIFYKTVRTYTECVPICNMYRGATPASANADAFDKGNGTICVRYPTTDRIYIRDDRFNNTTDFENAISGIQIIVKLATPVEIDLTELEVIETLNGVNNVWSDTNGVNTIKYMKKG